MKQYYELYISEGLKNKKEEILAKLKKRKPLLNKYLLVLAHNEQNHLEIFDSILLQQKVFAQEDLFLVGIADGYPNALELVERIAQEVYDKTGGTDIRGYLLDKQKRMEESVG
ncbi:MAG: hypothetical protein UHS49_01410 [Faecalimonas sp.]|nr:hypothetical protein [Faecalimonas sp.]